jgi:uncharacterized protein YbcC (UPF0753/DUF2309 family)
VDKQPLLFSTVDNAFLGVKITHNITGKFAVVQGNGGDIKWGFLQSVMDQIRNVPPATAIICRHTGQFRECQIYY